MFLPVLALFAPKPDDAGVLETPNGLVLAASKLGLPPKPPKKPPAGEISGKTILFYYPTCLPYSESARALARIEKRPVQKI